MSFLPTILPAHPEAPEESPRFRAAKERVLARARQGHGPHLPYTLGFIATPFIPGLKGC